MQLGIPWQFGSFAKGKRCPHLAVPISRLEEYMHPVQAYYFDRLNGEGRVQQKIAPQVLEAT